MSTKSKSQARRPTLRGTELISVDALYALERALWRYPGLKLAAIMDNGLLIDTDPETEEPRDASVEYCDPSTLVLRFTGPPMPPLGTPVSLQPTSPELLEEADDGLNSEIIRIAARAMEDGVRRDDLVRVVHLDPNAVTTSQISNHAVTNSQLLRRY
jgi:hypothetical protein